MDDPKTPVDGGEVNPEEKPGLDRRSVIKRLLIGAAAVGGTFAPTVKAFAQSSGQLSLADTNVTAVSMMTAMSEMTTGLIGPSASLKQSIVDKFNAAITAVNANQGPTALSRLDELVVIITVNQVELDASNGGIQFETDETPTASVGTQTTFGIFRKIGDLLNRGVQYVRSLGTSIVNFFVTVFSAKLRCVLDCLVAFASCVSKALGFFTSCFNFCKHLLPIPFIGNALFAVCECVCAAILAVQLGLCAAALTSCLRSC